MLGEQEDPTKLSCDHNIQITSDTSIRLKDCCFVFLSSRIAFLVVAMLTGVYSAFFLFPRSCLENLSIAMKLKSS